MVLFLWTYIVLLYVKFPRMHSIYKTAFTLIGFDVFCRYHRADTKRTANKTYDKHSAGEAAMKNMSKTCYPMPTAYTLHGANMGPTPAPDGPHVGPMNFAIRVGKPKQNLSIYGAIIKNMVVLSLNF